MPVVDQSISLFIPKVFGNIKDEIIVNAFSYLGDVRRIDKVAKYDNEGNTYNSVYVHFERWLNTEDSEDFQDSLSTDGYVELYYGPQYRWYWIVLLNKSKKHTPGARKARIDIGDTPAINVKTTDVTTNETDKGNQNDEEIDAEIEAEIEKMYDEMDAFEEEIDAENTAHMSSFDVRYVAILEQENRELKEKVSKLIDNVNDVYQLYSSQIVRANRLRDRLEEWEDSTYIDKPDFLRIGYMDW